MKESVFVKENAEKWKHYEAIIKDRSSSAADEIADNYIRVTDDLSYSATFYPESKTTAYLNQLSRSFHADIYRNKKERLSRILQFFKVEIPRAVFESHRQLLYAFIFFILSVAAAVLSSFYDDNFIRFILSDGYINMTLENIEKGDPMAVYKSMNSGSMFLGIAINNIYVSFIAFIYGVFLSVGTVYLLVNNGMMVGAFITFFIKKGLTQVALLSIFLHGALELSSIVIAGGAGMVIGNSILFPGTYSRAEAFTKAGKRALKISVGLVPVFIVAAFFEGFLTRHYQELSVAMSLAVIVLSFAFIGWCFIILPLKLKSKYGWQR